MLFESGGKSDIVLDSKVKLLPWKPWAAIVLVTSVGSCDATGTGASGMTGCGG